MADSSRAIDELAHLTRMAELASFLANSFEKEVDPSFLKKIQANFPEFSSWIGQMDQAHLHEGCRLVEEFIDKSRVIENLEGLLEELAVEYAGLFLGAGVTPVPVIESVYRGVDHILYEKPYFDVLAFYRENNYQKPEPILEPEDHLAVELDFYALQLHGAAHAIEGGNDDARIWLDIAQRFKKEHLDLWVPQACNDLFKAAETPFYLGIAHLTMGLIENRDITFS